MKPRTYEKVIAEDGTKYLVTDWKGYRYTGTFDGETAQWFIVTERLRDGHMSKGKFYERLKHCKAFERYSWGG